MIWVPGGRRAADVEAATERLSARAHVGKTMMTGLVDGAGPETAAQETAAMWQVADCAPLLGANAAGDELGDQARLVDKAEGRVLRSDQITHAVDNQLQDLLNVEDAADAADGGVERLKRRRKGRTLSSWLSVARHADRLARLRAPAGEWPEPTTPGRVQGGRHAKWSIAIPGVSQHQRGPRPAPRSALKYVTFDSGPALGERSMLAGHGGSPGGAAGAADRACRGGRRQVQ